MIPQISVLLVCGYYGYPTYDENFVKKCKASGVSVIVDTTHTAFSPLPACPDADYIAVSLRKWMGVASGGLAIKRKGTFGVKPIPINKEQFSLRDQALQSRETYEHTGNEDYNKEGNDVFWKAEFMLREIFDIQEGDEASLKTILHYPFRDAIRKRQENYRYLLEHLPERSDIRPVFPYLSDDICPMFFPFFVENRDALIKHLADRHIPPKVYWPSGIPVALMLSLIRIIRSAPIIWKVARTEDGWIWMPSQMISAIACGQSAAAPIMPGSRWCSGGMALNRWVTWLAPAAKAFSAISYDAVECPSEIATVSLNSRINASEPGSSGAIVMMRILFPLAAESRRNMAASGACR